MGARRGGNRPEPAPDSEEPQGEYEHEVQAEEEGFLVSQDRFGPRA